MSEQETRAQLTRILREGLRLAEQAGTYGAQVGAAETVLAALRPYTETLKQLAGLDAEHSRLQREAHEEN